MGFEADARSIIIEKQRALRKHGSLNLFSRIWNWIMDMTLGYGYRPLRVILAMLIILLLGWSVFKFSDAAGIMQPSKERVYMDRDFMKKQQLPAQYPRFSSFMYSLDVFVPFVDLHQESYWLPDVTKSNGKTYYGNTLGYWTRIYLWFHIIAGWVTSTLAAVYLTGLVRKE
jgi:hypothetical protein